MVGTSDDAAARHLRSRKTERRPRVSQLENYGSRYQGGKSLMTKEKEYILRTLVTTSILRESHAHVFSLSLSLSSDRD